MVMLKKVSLLKKTEQIEFIVAPLFDIDENKLKRNMLLLESDKMMIEDRPSDKDAWKAYRQQLRDLPETDGWPNNIKWPSMPES